MAAKKAKATVKKSTKVSPMMLEKKAATELPEPDYDLEMQKLRGQTEGQLAMKAYHEGKFQTHDPVTGEKRDKTDSVGE